MPRAPATSRTTPLGPATDAGPTPRGEGLPPEKEGTAPDERRRNGTIPAARHTRGGSSYQHSLSARGIKSSGRARSCSDEDLLASMERLERATRIPSFEDDENETRRKRPYGRQERGTGTARGAGEQAEKRLRGPRFSW